VEHGSSGGALFHVEQDVNWVESGWKVSHFSCPQLNISIIDDIKYDVYYAIGSTFAIMVLGGLVLDGIWHFLLDCVYYFGSYGYISHFGHLIIDNNE
jgi:hypothetical protein